MENRHSEYSLVRGYSPAFERKMGWVIGNLDKVLNSHHRYVVVNGNLGGISAHFYRTLDDVYNDCPMLKKGNRMGGTSPLLVDISALRRQIKNLKGKRKKSDGSLQH